jgi:oxygen-independent coproporphyrinogen-3 oxidase
LLAPILLALRERFGVAPNAELTLEADPGTFDAALLAEFRALGFNRLSVGVQSLDDGILKACGRAHGAAEAAAALDLVAAAGFRSWSLDLMGGLPGLTRPQWRETLKAAAARAPPHVSVYDLQIEPGTPFARWYTAGAAPLPDEGDAAGMYEDAVEVLTGAGYEHYEVSSYAAGRANRSAHNQVYWAAGAPYYAFGVGAASYLAGRRFSRPKRLDAYEAWVGEFEAAGAGGQGSSSGSGGGQVDLLVGVPGAKELPPETAEDRLLDAVMLGLRTSDGLDLAALAAAYGDGAVAAMLPALERHEQRGLVQLTRGGGGGGGGGGGSSEVVRARLTDPRGFMLSNDVISDLFAVL